MKQEQSYIKYGVIDTQWESRIAERCTSLCESSIESAKDQAASNLPPAECTPDHARPYIGSISQSFQLLVDENHQNFQLDAQKEKLRRVQKDAVVEAESLKVKKGEVSTKLKIAQRDVERKGLQSEIEALISKEKVSKRWTPLVILIVSCDALVSSTVLQQLSYPLWLALLVGISISAGLYTLTHIVPGRIHKAQTRGRKISIAVGTSIGVCLIFGIFASFREQSAGSKYAFIAINYFTFLCASLITYSKALTPSENETLHRYKAIRGHLDSLTKAKEDIEQRESACASRVTQAEEEYKALSAYAEGLEKTIVSQYHICYQQYIEQNLFHRSDNAVPQFFSDPAPALTLHLKNRVS